MEGHGSAKGRNGNQSSKPLDASAAQSRSGAVAPATLRQSRASNSWPQAQMIQPKAHCSPGQVGRNTVQATSHKEYFKALPSSDTCPLLLPLLQVLPTAEDAACGHGQGLTWASHPEGSSQASAAQEAANQQCRGVVTASVH